MYTADERDTTRNNSLTAGANAVLPKETPVYDIPLHLANYLLPTGPLG
jgi:hypothetical protein